MTSRDVGLAVLLYLELDVDFMEEKLREAIAVDASQAGAVSEAAGVLPLLRANRDFLFSIA